MDCSVGVSAVTDSNEVPGEPRFEFTRRTFMEQTGRTGSAAFLAQYALSTEVSEAINGDDWTPTQEMPTVDEEALIELDVDEARVVQAMTARIMPSDEVGPGAVDTGVVYFIDRQLAGAWGFGENFYLEPPFKNRYAGAKPNQGYQSRLTPRELYKFAIDWTNDYARQEYGAAFIDLSADEQDQVLLDIQNNEPDNFQSIFPEEFFELLRQNTLEGMYCDPAYEGNRNMAGWKMKEFPGSPGALGSYRDLIGEEEFLNLQPRSIEDDVEAVGVETGILPADAGASEEANGGDDVATGDEGTGGEGGATGGGGGQSQPAADQSHGHGYKHAEGVELPDGEASGDPVPGHGPRWALVDEDDDESSAVANEDVAENPADRAGGDDR